MFGFPAITVPLQALTYEGPQKAAQAAVLIGSFFNLVMALSASSGEPRCARSYARLLTVAALAILLAAAGIVILLTFYRLGGTA